MNADAYIQAGLPWFDYFDAELEDVEASKKLAGVKTVGTLLEGGLEGAASVVVPTGDGRVISYGAPRNDLVLPGEWTTETRR